MRFAALIARSGILFKARFTFLVTEKRRALKKLAFFIDKRNSDIILKQIGSRRGIT
jgi:hypothetical protein